MCLEQSTDKPLHVSEYFQYLKIIFHLEKQ